MAQDEAGQDPINEPRRPTGTEASGEIIVTATRRSESAQKVPASISAMSGDMLSSMKIDNAGALGAIVPGLNVSLPYGAGVPPIFTLRGIAANDFSFTQSRPIALYQDDSIRASPVFEAIPFFDIERVEALKGPQGTLYGKNATGGAINIVSKAPGFDTSGYLTLGYGKFNTREAKGALQTALIGDILASRLAFTYEKNDGFVRNLNPSPQANNQDQSDVLGVRLSLLFKPSSEFDATLRLGYNRSGGAAFATFGAVTDPVVTGGFTRAGLSFYENNNQRHSQKLLENYGANLQMNYHLGEIDLTSITAIDRGMLLSRTDDDGLPIALVETDQNARKALSFSQELRAITSFSGPFNVTVGALYGRDSMNFDQVFNFFNEPSLGVVDPFGFGTTGFGASYGNSFHQSRSGWAVYGRAELALTSLLKATGGVRYSKDKISLRNFDAFLASNPGPGAPNLDAPTFLDQQRSSRFDNVSFEAGLEWSVDPNILIYGNFRQGYRTGAYNAQAYFSPDEINAVKPETANAFELGIKSQMFERRFTVNLAAFHTSYNNQQVLNTDSTTGLSSLISQDAKIYGIELDTRLKVWDGFVLNGGVSWINPEYQRGAQLSPSFDGSGNPIPGSGVSIGKNQIAGAARITGTAGATLDLAKTSAGIITLQLDGSYTSRIYYDVLNTRSSSSGPRWVQNGRIALEGRNFTFALFSKNIFGKKYFAYSTNLQDGFGYIQFVRGAPRTIGGEVTLKF